ncbi:hypothetical protein JRC04_05555 [Mycolicibacterium sp. S2-37]|uniref:hypothetical protein n=1 Tax=Mycolicibacterium sp. S2-37 TaxID=2810297 RepID=UPI001A940556|nr:hypothetical protein [Mycolicibacterium sp. S2-37]MBO0676922.1 hypothetical protein [Mycolicibacterium sp. S2-37]
MKPSQKMAKRIELVNFLHRIDTEMTHVLAKPATREVINEARKILHIRTRTEEKLLSVGYQPWPGPYSEDESRVS